MRKSYSKIRHIQESNLRLEKRFLNENIKDQNLSDENDDSPESFEEPIPSDDDEFEEINSDDIQDYGFDYEDDDADDKRYKEFLRKKIKPSSIQYPTRRWDKGDEEYKPYSPLKSSDMDLITFLKSKEKD